MLVNVEYLHHSGYVVETEDTVLIFDFVEGLLPRKYLATDKNVVFFVSHGHKGHYHPGIFNYKKQVVVFEDVKIPVHEKAIQVKPNDTLIVNGLKIKVFDSTVFGVCFLAQTKDISVFHAGDFNYWHWKLENTEDEIELSSLQFLTILEDLAKEHIDFAMFPVDPRMKKDYDEGARMFINKVKPAWFFPMHYNDKEDISEFVQWIGQQDVLYRIPSYPNQAFECEVLLND